MLQRIIYKSPYFKLGSPLNIPIVCEAVAIPQLHFMAFLKILFVLCMYTAESAVKNLTYAPEYAYEPRTLSGRTSSFKR